MLPKNCNLWQADFHHPLHSEERVEHVQHSVQLTILSLEVIHHGPVLLSKDLDTLFSMLNVECLDLKIKIKISF